MTIFDYALFHGDFCKFLSCAGWAGKREIGRAGLINSSHSGQEEWQKQTELVAYTGEGGQRHLVISAE